MAAQLTLTGFKNLAEINAFLTWFSNSGEQELYEDLECRREEGNTELPTSINVDWGTDQYVEINNQGGQEVTYVVQNLECLYEE